MSEHQPITIIHLEDDSLDVELTTEILQAGGIRCEIHHVNHQEGFRQLLQDYLHQDNFSLILADYNMPGFDGLTALRMTRQVDSDVPFILLSGALGEELAVELLRNGATDYVLKHNMQRLPHVVNRALEEYAVRLRQRKSDNEIRRARDEAQKANAAKSRFLGRISHELRTPLNAIIGYTQLMQSDPMTTEQQHCSSQILKAGEHLLQLINEVLDITQIESGAISLVIKHVAVTSVIERSVDLLRTLARDAGVTLSMEDSHCDISVLTDRDRLTQVVINLLTNAVKYTDRGGRVEINCEEVRPGIVRIYVRDTGIGIAPEKMERLFTPFDRLDLERDPNYAGTGLGLTVSKAIVEAMGGEIGVESTVGKGSTFWIEIPGVLPDDSNGAPATAPPAP